MALSSPALYASILGASSYKGSKTFPWIALAVSQAYVQWMRTPSAVLLRGNAVGFLGGGTVTGKFFLQATGLVPASLIAAGLSASVWTPIGQAIEQGVASTVTASAQYQGTSVAVGTGSDTAQVQLANRAVLLGYLTAALQTAGIAGQLQSQVARGLSSGLTNLTKTGYGIGAVVGANTGTPGVGQTISVVL